MKQRSRVILGLAGAGLAAIVWWVMRAEPVPVEVAKVELATFEQTVDEEGKTRVHDRYTVSAPVAGRLGRIALRAGDRVRAGDVIAVLRPLPASLQDARSVAELRERLGAAEAGTLRADANVERLRVATEQARFDAERARKLAAQGFASKSAEEQAWLAVSQQAQALKAAQFEQHAAEHELQMAKAALAQGDRSSAGAAKIEIRAPSDGQLLRVIQESEGAVASGAPLLEIGDARSLEAVIEVLSQDATRIQPGMRVRMTASPGGSELPGRVFRIEPGARTKVSALGVEEQRVGVVVQFDAPPVGLGDGWRVEARITVFTRKEVPVVPVGALFRDGDGWAVFALENGRAARRTVKLGGRNVHGALITDGVPPGATVVIYPPDTVRDGVGVGIVPRGMR